MVESSYITPKWTCLTSQNKAILHLQAPPWNAFWIADKYLGCGPFHGKYSLQISYSRFLKLTQRAVSTATFRMRGKRGDLWEELHSCWWKLSLLDSSNKEAASDYVTTQTCSIMPESRTCTSVQIHFLGFWLSRFSSYSQRPRSYLCSGWDPTRKHCTESTFQLQHIHQIYFKRQKTSRFTNAILQCNRNKNCLTKPAPSVTLVQTHQFTTIRRTPARFDWSQE